MTIKQIEEIQPLIEMELINRAEITLKTKDGEKHFISVGEVENIIDKYLKTRFAKMHFIERTIKGK